MSLFSFGFGGGTTLAPDYGKQISEEEVIKRLATADNPELMGTADEGLALDAAKERFYSRPQVTSNGQKAGTTVNVAAKNKNAEMLGAEAGAETSGGAWSSFLGGLNNKVAGSLGSLLGVGKGPFTVTGFNGGQFVFGDDGNPGFHGGQFGSGAKQADEENGEGEATKQNGSNFFGDLFKQGFSQLGEQAGRQPAQMQVPSAAGVPPLQQMTWNRNQPINFWRDK